MARDFDDFPTYDPLVRRHLFKFYVGRLFSYTFIQTLQGYLTQWGDIIPNITLAQRKFDTEAPQEGQMIYVTDANMSSIIKDG